MRRNWEEFQDQQFLNQEKLLLMQPKPLGLGRWSLLPLFRGPAKIATTCDNATLWAVGKAQFLRNKGITLECQLNFFSAS